jgi:hypothetical protein
MGSINPELDVNDTISVMKSALEIYNKSISFEIIYDSSSVIQKKPSEQSSNIRSQRIERVLDEMKILLDGSFQDSLSNVEQVNQQYDDKKMVLEGIFAF